MDVVNLARTDSLIPAKRLGSVVCVAMIERSAHAKARVMGMHICQECIDQVGLSACGKRGVLATAKSLSGEKVAENKMSALDLMETILARMNGEIERLCRICGPSLSEKGLQLLEEKWHKRGTASQTPARVQKPALSAGTPETQRGLYDELPALSLRPSGRVTTKAREHPSDNQKVETTDVFAFSRNAPTLERQQLDLNGVEQTASRVPSGQENGSGTASSLRARLQAIREKTKAPLEDAPVISSDAKEQMSLGADLPMNDSLPPFSATEVYEKDMETVRELIVTIGPLDEDDPGLLACVETLKRFHAALSKQHNPVVGLTVEQLSRLRECIKDRMDSTVEQLTRCVVMCFDIRVSTMINLHLCQTYWIFVRLWRRGS